MRHVLTILIILLTYIIAVGVHREAVPTEVVAIDMRHGLPESRVRALRVLPDGRLAVATAGYLSIFDGIRFFNEPIDASKGIAVSSLGKNRKLFYDRNGILWLKTPMSRSDNTGRLHAFNAVSGKDITEEVVAELGNGDVCDFFVDERGTILIIDADKNLCIVEDKERKPMINIGAVARELPSVVNGDGEKIFLCYDSGNVCVFNLQTRLLEYMARAPFPKMNSRLINGIAKWENGKLWIPFHRHNDNASSWIASLDTASRTWSLRHLDCLVYDFIVKGNDSITYSFPEVDDEIFCMEKDRKGGLWIGTGNSGLCHFPPSGDRFVTQNKGIYPYPANGYFPDDRAKIVTEKYASGILNSSAVDSVNGYVYLATRKGLMVIDRKGKLVATLNDNVGLPNNNVQSVIANVGKNGHREVWFATTTGFSRLRHLSDDTLEIIHLGVLDGVDLNGKEFASQEMTTDSLGFIVAGFPGGWVRFNPAEVDITGHVVHKYPDDHGTNVTNNEENSVIPVSLFRIGVAAISLAIILFICVAFYRMKHRMYKSDSGKDDAPTEVNLPGVSEKRHEQNKLCNTLVNRLRETTKPSSGESSSYDIDFVTKINKIIESHIDDETLSVVSLSSMMAMDRTNLYRRMQSVMGKSPSVYIKEMRLSVAARLLKETDLSVQDIASRTGFSSTKYFSASFKEKFGMLPARYRES